MAKPIGGKTRWRIVDPTSHNRTGRSMMLARQITNVKLSLQYVSRRYKHMARPPAVVRFDRHNNLSGRQRCLSSPVATRKPIKNIVFIRTKPVQLGHTTFMHADVESRHKWRWTWFYCLFSVFWRPLVPRIIPNSTASSSTWTTLMFRGR